MKRYIKNGLRVLGDYGLMLLIFVVFLYVILVLGSNNLKIALMIYSICVGLLLCLMLNSDMHKLASKEKKPQNGIKSRSYDGFFFGLIGVVPIVVIEVLSVFLTFQDQAVEKIKHYILQIFMGPVYFIVKSGSNTFWGYFTATLFIIVISGFTYLLGYREIYIAKILGIERKPVQPQSKSNQKKGFDPYKTHPWYKK